MSRYAMARRQRKWGRLRSYPGSKIREQSRHELIARAASRQEVLVSNDIHRLVRVTAYNALILQRSPARWQHPATQVHHRGDGPGL